MKNIAFESDNMSGQVFKVASIEVNFSNTFFEFFLNFSFSFAMVTGHHFVRPLTSLFWTADDFAHEFKSGRIHHLGLGIELRISCVRREFFIYFCYFIFILPFLIHFYLFLHLLIFLTFYHLFWREILLK